MKPLHIGFFNNQKFGSSRYTDLIPVLNTIPGVKAESYAPFTPYTHLIIQESALEPGAEKLFAGSLGARWVFDSDRFLPFGNEVFSTHCDLLVSSELRKAELMKKVLKRSTHFIADGVMYRPARPYKKTLTNLVWYGKSSALSELYYFRPALEQLAPACRLKVVTDSHEEYVKFAEHMKIDMEYKPYLASTFEREMETSDIAILPPNDEAHAAGRFFEAAIRGMPFIWGTSGAYETLYNQFLDMLGGTNDLLKGFTPGEKPREFLDQYEMWSLGLEPMKQLLKVARKFTLEQNLVQNRAEAWMEILTAGEHA